MTLKKNGAPIQSHSKRCALFRSHQWIETGLTVLKRSIRVKIGDFLSRVTLRFDDWHWKTIWHFFCATLSFVHHFVAMGELQVELQSENAQFQPKQAFFVPCDLEIWRMTLKKICRIFYTTSSFVHHFIAIGEFKLELQSGKAQFESKLAMFCPMWTYIWWMALKNNRAPLLCHFKLCASFRSRRWIRG